MKILIRDMVMPRTCATCPLAHWNQAGDLTGCNIGKRFPNKEDTFWTKDRPDWCRLEEAEDDA